MAGPRRAVHDPGLRDGTESQAYVLAVLWDGIKANKVLGYIESCGSSREEAVQAVCDAFLAVLDEWVRPFAPSMTYSKQMPTSSGHIFQLE